MATKIGKLLAVIVGQFPLCTPLDYVALVAQEKQKQPMGIGNPIPLRRFNMLEELRESIEVLENLRQFTSGTPTKRLDLAIQTLQLILDSKGWPEKRKVGQYPIDYDYRAEGFNEALSLCLAARVKEKVELIGKIPTFAELVKIADNVLGYEGIGTKMTSQEITKVFNAIHSELMRRLK